MERIKNKTKKTKNFLSLENLNICTEQNELNVKSRWFHLIKILHQEPVLIKVVQFHKVVLFEHKIDKRIGNDLFNIVLNEYLTEYSLPKDLNKIIIAKKTKHIIKQINEKFVDISNCCIDIHCADVKISFIGSYGEKINNKIKTIFSKAMDY